MAYILQRDEDREKQQGQGSGQTAPGQAAPTAPTAPSSQAPSAPPNVFAPLLGTPSTPNRGQATPGFLDYNRVVAANAGQGARVSDRLLGTTDRVFNRAQTGLAGAQQAFDGQIQAFNAQLAAPRALLRGGPPTPADAPTDVQNAGLRARADQFDEAGRALVDMRYAGPRALDLGAAGDAARDGAMRTRALGTSEGRAALLAGGAGTRGTRGFDALLAGAELGGQIEQTRAPGTELERLFETARADAARRAAEADARAAAAQAEGQQLLDGAAGLRTRADTNEGRLAEGHARRRDLDSSYDEALNRGGVSWMGDAPVSREEWYEMPDDVRSILVAEGLGGNLLVPTRGRDAITRWRRGRPGRR
jgi:hypothetical protein